MLSRDQNNVTAVVQTAWLTNLSVVRFFFRAVKLKNVKLVFHDTFCEMFSVETRPVLM